MEIRSLFAVAQAGVISAPMCVVVILTHTLLLVLYVQPVLLATSVSYILKFEFVA